MRTRQRRWKSPSFPVAEGRPARAVIEGVDGAERWLVARALEEVGFEVLTCNGPVEQQGPCPLVAGRGCSAVEDADVVVNLLGLRHPSTQEIVTAIRAARPDIGIVAQASAYDVTHLSELLRDTGCTVVSPLASSRSFATAAQQAAR
jgi:hypothetical protein